MAKLKCDRHDRRVMILEGSGAWVHRTGDLSACDSWSAHIGEQEIQRGTMALTKIDLTRKNVDPAQKLLYDIFAEGPKRKDAFTLHPKELPIFAPGATEPFGYSVLTEKFEFTAEYCTDDSVGVYVDWGSEQPGEMASFETMLGARDHLNALLAEVDKQKQLTPQQIVDGFNELARRENRPDRWVVRKGEVVKRK